MSSIVGLAWRKLTNSPDSDEENKYGRRPETSKTGKRKRVVLKEMPNRPTTASLVEAELKRMTGTTSVKEAFGTLRQKLTRKMSMRRRKRLVNLAEGSPCTSYLTTPLSLKKSARRAQRQEETRMYSPFCIDSPSRTPRMGTRQRRRINFSSPGQFEKDLDLVSEGIQSLAKTGESFEKVIAKDVTRPSQLAAGFPNRRMSPRLRNNVPMERTNGRSRAIFV